MLKKGFSKKGAGRGWREKSARTGRWIRERETETESDRERDRDRQTDIDRQRPTERQTGRGTETGPD